MLLELSAGGPNFASYGSNPRGGSKTCLDYGVYYSNIMLGELPISDFKTVISSLFYDSGLKLKDYMYNILSDYTHFTADEKQEIRQFLHAFIM